MKVERRLLSLVALLRRARAPLPRAAIFEAMAGMDDGYPADRPEAARKKLQRDLQHLEDLGVVVRWDATRGGYALAPSAREPVILRLDPEDAELLVEAVGRVTGGAGRLSATVEAALEQHEARDVRRSGPLRVHQPVRGAVDGATFDALVEAAWRRRVIRFAYVTLDGRSGAREVEPWGLFLRERAWHVVGLDRARGAPRCFRLAAVRELDVSGPEHAFERPAGDAGDVRAWARLERWQWAVHPPVEVELACHEVAPLVAAACGGRAEGDRVRVTVTHLDGLVPLLLRWAPRARPVRPPELVEAVRARVSRVAARHGEGT